MITLDPTLKAAQDGDVHQPIIKLTSESFVASIPFEGNAFNFLTENETNPDVIEHSTGRLATVFGRDTDIVLLITNVDKTEWAEYTLYDGGNTYKSCICELDNGNLGIIFRNHLYDIWYFTAGIDGSIITAPALINNYSTWVSAPSVELLANGTFLLVYAYKNGSNEYSISKRTSSDFITWSSVTTIAPTGLDNTFRIDNTHIRQLSSGEIFLLFDYVDDVQDASELVNCYLIRSSDNGNTWTDPEQITDYDSHGTSGKDPVVSERPDGSVELAFYEEKGVLQMDRNTAGWQSGQDGTPHMRYNPAPNKLYTKQNYSSIGNKVLTGCTVIDVATWTIDKAYTGSTVPAINSLFLNEHTSGLFDDDIDDGKYLVTSCYEATMKAIMVIDTETDTITNYLFNTDVPAYGLTSNLTFDGAYNEQSNIRATWTDAANDKLYVLFSNGYGSRTHLAFGFIDLTEQPDPVTDQYSWNQIFSKQLSNAYYNAVVGNMAIDISANLIMVSFGDFGGSHGNLMIWDLASGGFLYDFNRDDYPGFPYKGMGWPCYYNGHIYGNVIYYDLHGNEDRYGLADLNLATESVAYHRPSWGTFDNYALRFKKSMGDGRLVMASYGHGIATFDTASGGWVLYNEENVPGIELQYGSDDWVMSDYDPIEKIIFASSYSGGSGGVVAFPEDGEFSQLRYLPGVYTTSWDFGASNILVEGFISSQPAVIIDPDDVLWALWTNKTGTEQSLYWDQETATKELTDLLVDNAVTISHEIDSISTLSFGLSHGHLFDPSNQLSTLAPYLKKGRKIKLQLGETIDSVDYLQDQGSYVITDVKVNYNSGEYPIINVNCEDLRTLWQEGKVSVTDHYDDADPDVVLKALLQEYGNLLSENINIPTLDDSHTLYHQFIDQDLTEMLDIILSHFNYFLFFEVDEVVTIRKIDLTKDPDRVDTTKLINYSPDDSFSNFINRVVCSGEGKPGTAFEVLYDMESVGTLSGTVVPFGGTQIKRVWYSEDHVRTCRDPQLEVITSVREYELFLIEGGGNEYISDVDFQEHYVDITIEAPDLTGVFLSIAASIIATGIAAIYCTLKCGPFIYALSVETQLMGYALGAVAQYEYNIYAKPIGHEKQTFQSTSNDLVSQRELNGQIITAEIIDPLCYEVIHSQRVADQELNITIAQRKRVSYSKIAHLQDEVGDTLQNDHPYTNLPLKFFITKLIRVYQKEVGMTDKVEGWRV